MRINNFLHNTSPLSIAIGFDAEGAGEGGGTPTPAPASSLLGGEGEGDAGSGSDGGDGGSGGDTGAGDGGSGDGSDGDSAKPDGDAGEGDGGKEGEADGEGGAGEGEGGEGEGDQQTGAPETYDFSSAFDGEDAPQLNEETLEEFTSILREDNLTQEQANRYMGIAKKLQDQWLNEVTQHHIDTRAEWRKAAQEHPEFGGEKFAENIALAKQARDAFGSENLGKLLDETGLGDHPEVIAFFYKVGKANSEHDFVNAGKPAKTQSFYDHPTSKGRKK